MAAAQAQSGGEATAIFVSGTFDPVTVTNTGSISTVGSDSIVSYSASLQTDWSLSIQNTTAGTVSASGQDAYVGIFAQDGSSNASVMLALANYNNTAGSGNALYPDQSAGTQIEFMATDSTGALTAVTPLNGDGFNQSAVVPSTQNATLMLSYDAASGTFTAFSGNNEIGTYNVGSSGADWNAADSVSSVVLQGTDNIDSTTPAGSALNAYPVPEPPVTGMVLGGSAVLAWAALRKRRTESA